MEPQSCDANAAAGLESPVTDIAQRANTFVNENKRYSIFSFFVVLISLIPLAFKDGL